MENLVGGLIILVGFGAALAYLPLQVYTVVRLRGVWRLVALLPVLLMVPIISLTAYALAQQSNLWPLYLIFGAPVGTGYLAVLLFIRGLAMALSSAESEPLTKADASEKTTKE
jgi:hypothetical protein